jgi:parvulin-like peptidyl-prolyl isomerase
LGGPVKINDRQFGEVYSVIKLEGRTEGGVQPLDEVKDRVTTMARREKDQTIFKNWVQNARSHYKIDIYDDVIASTVQEKEGESADTTG